MSTTNTAFDFIVLGDNVRSVVASALRAGYVVWGADATSSLDLQALLPTSYRCPSGQYPQAFVDILADAPEGQSWLYTSALDQYPNLLRQLIELRPLAGNGVNAVGFTRSHDEIQHTLRELGYLTPQFRGPRTERPDYCQWVLHTVGQSRGFGRGFVDKNAELPSTASYLREHIEGSPMSASFVSSSNGCRVLGVTELLLGTDWLHAPGFAYAGDVGPIELSESVREELFLIAKALVERGRLRGLFAIDFILRDERVWVVHVHPTYTESMEIIELTRGGSVLAAHFAATGYEQIQQSYVPAQAVCAARGILHAPCRLTIPNTLEQVVLPPPILPLVYLRPEYSDIPRAGEVVEQGWPIMSIFAYGLSKQECLRRLHEQAESIREVILGERPRVRHTDWYARLDDPDSD